MAGRRGAARVRVFQSLPGYSFDTQDGLFEFMIDQGDNCLDEATLRAVHLPPYIAAIEAGVLVVMASLSSRNGLKIHAHHQLLTEVLKGELGFTGFVVSDWAGIDPGIRGLLPGSRYSHQRWN